MRRGEEGGPALQFAGGVADQCCAGRDVPGHHRACADHGPAADPQAGQDGGAET